MNLAALFLRNQRRFCMFICAIFCNIEKEEVKIFVYALMQWTEYGWK
jgi:hypothetical protein